MSITFKQLQRQVSRLCNDVVEGKCTSAGSTTTLVDTRLGATYKSNDYFNGGVIVLPEGGAQMLFDSDCEAVPPGDFTSVTVTDNDCKLYRSTTAHTGTYAYQFVTGADASDQAYALKTLGAAITTIYAQAMFRASASYTGASYILQLQTNAGAAIVSVRLTNGVLAVYDHTGAQALTPTSTAFSTDAWHRIEIGLVVSATVGQIDLWLDGAPIYSGRGLNTGSTGIQKVAYGLIGTTVAQTKTIYVDNPKIDSAYIGEKSAESEAAITDYVVSTSTVTFGAVSVAPAANDPYEIYDWPSTKWGLNRKKTEINNAIASLWPHWWKNMVDPATDSGDATITTATNTFHYVLPSNCGLVLAVYVQGSSTSQPYAPLIHWDVMRSGNTQYLHLPNAGAYPSGRSVRVVYCKTPSKLVNDNDVLDVDASYEEHAAEYVVYSVLAALWLSTGSPDDADLAMSTRWKQLAMEVRQSHSMPRPTANIAVDVGATRQSWKDRVTDPSVLTR